MASDNADRTVFRRTVAKVFAVQIAALLLLWLIQARFTP